MKSQMAGVLNLCFSIFKGIFAASALFQRAAAVTWEWDFDRQGVHAGHYFMEN